MTRKTKIAVTITHTPYGNQFAQEAMDALLALSIYAQKISVVFIGEGVFQLLTNHHNKCIQQKSIEKQLDALALYDIDSVYACQQSLDERKIATAQIAQTVTPLNKTALLDLLHQQDSLISF